MKTYKKHFLHAKNTIHENKPKVLILSLTSSIILLTIFYLFPIPESLPTSNNNVVINIKNRSACDIFRGEWVRETNAPYYTNETCWAIHDNQNCIKYGRPDTEFMGWRWKPNECELPRFNPGQFLEIVRGKSLAFVGDSLGRNQMQSLMCQLLRVSNVIDVSPTTDYYSRSWLFPNHNFTLANFWSPLLVEGIEADPNGDPLNGLYTLHLDKPDKNWTSYIEQFDYVIISAGHWFFRPVMYYENNKLVGCSNCKQENISDLTMYYGYARAFRTSFRAMCNLPGFKGTTFLRTFSPGHFENGEWNKGGDCVRTRPFRMNETRLDGFVLQLYMTQIEEFRVAENEASKSGLRFHLLDVTEIMLLRPDGHPSRYGHWKDEKVLQYNDCVHWCLPGPVDVWNDLLMEIMKMEALPHKRILDQSRCSEYRQIMREIPFILQEGNTKFGKKI